MPDYYEYAPQVHLSAPIVVSSYLADFTRTVTYRAASLLGLSYHDIDRLVEHETAMEIGRLVLEQGEAAYRQVESHCLLRVLAQRPFGLIALGDGGLLRPENVAHVQNVGQLVVFDFELANLFWRVQRLARRLDPTRWHPLFAGVPENLAQIRPYYQERREAFDKAGTRIHADTLSAADACRVLMDCITTTRA